MLWFSVALAALFLVLGLEVAFGIRQIRRLCDVVLPQDARYGRVSVIIAVRDEAQHVEQALQSVLHQDHPDYEVIVVNDRSADGTREILERMAKTYPRIHLRHVTELPAGWLGKNHALQLGAELATGEFLLFTDADVVFAPDTLRKACHYVQTDRADHLALLPKSTFSTFGTKVFAAVFYISFQMFVKGWKVHKKNKHAVGIGAFNFVRKSVYEKAGGHRALPLRIDDDVHLGRVLKRSGASPRLLDGNGQITFPFYPTVAATIRGFEKNMFAGLEYNVFAVIGATLALSVLYFWPWVALFVTEGTTRWIYVGIISFQYWLFVSSAPVFREPRLPTFFFPVGWLFFLYALWNSTLKTLIQGGVRWRDTFYPLDELKRGL